MKSYNFKRWDDIKDSKREKLGLNSQAKNAIFDMASAVLERDEEIYTAEIRNAVGNDHIAEVVEEAILEELPVKKVDGKKFVVKDKENIQKAIDVVKSIENCPDTEFNFRNVMDALDGIKRYGDY